MQNSHFRTQISLASVTGLTAEGLGARLVMGYSPDSYTRSNRFSPVVYNSSIRAKASDSVKACSHIQILLAEWTKKGEGHITNVGS